MLSATVRPTPRGRRRAEKKAFSQLSELHANESSLESPLMEDPPSHSPKPLDVPAALSAATVWRHHA
ncbi:hypothetical protein ACFPRL_17945 [Pseudoclavibacter helvolus]